MNWAARSLPVHVVSLTVLLEPAGAAVLAWVALGQLFGWAEVIGAGLLLIGAGISATDQGGVEPPD
jgi:drug/metabolite transporter (DMT)-like permease